MTRSLRITHGAGPLLARILDQPQLVQQVQALPAARLGRLIQQIGLEDAGELVAMATTEQLERMFDDDLWRGQQLGGDEQFDAERFGLWLAVMLEAGAEFATRKLLLLDEELLTYALSQHVLVIDIEALAIDMSARAHSDDDEQLEKQLGDSLHQELEEFRVIAREPGSWESILAVLLELNEQHHEVLQRLLSRCCDLSAGYIDDNGGLYEVLSEQQTLFEDVASAREERQEQRGYLAPSAAGAFLSLACVESEEEIVAAQKPDPITRSYLHTIRLHTARPLASEESTASALAPLASERSPLLELLNELERHDQPSAARRIGAKQGGFARAMQHLLEHDPALHGQRVLELAYLCNVVLSGCWRNERALRPVEAAEAAARLCELGAQRLAQHSYGKRELPRGALTQHSLVLLFRLGFRWLATGLPARHADRAAGSPLVGLQWKRSVGQRAANKAGQPPGR